MSFLNHVRTEDYKPGEFVVIEPLHYVSGDWQYTIPKRFITDFASIPGVVRLLPGFDVNGDSRRPSVLHDFAYSCHGKLTIRNIHSGELREVNLSRAECDALFREALESVGISKALASLYWAGVRAGGWLYWNKRVDGLRQDFDFAEVPK